MKYNKREEENKNKKVKTWKRNIKTNICNKRARACQREREREKEIEKDEMEEG